ncbi:MAG: hypothetical protein OER90_10770 [Gemmatimonadota bacterium]|nr:hypothetical protein [Gemmatimonadota bacterium]
MSEILGILGLMVLFVAFGLMHRGGQTRAGCGSCPHEPGPDCSCDVIHDISESTHVRR